MPLFPSSFFIPPSSVPFLVEDKYVRGGYICIADATARDALHMAIRKKGMIVVTQDDGKSWTLRSGTSNSDWEEYNPFVGSTKLASPLGVDGDGKLSLDTSGATEGQALAIDSNGDAVWSSVGGGSGGFTPTRATKTYTPSSAMTSGATDDFTLVLGKAVVVLEMTLSHPDIKIEAFGTPDRTETNPYTFLSAADHLSDDGTSKMNDGSTQYNRRYAILSNNEGTVGTSIYFRLTNENATSITPTVDIKYLIIE